MGSPISRAEAAALAEQHGRPYLTQLLHEKGNSDAAAGYEEKRLVVDELAMVHLHVRQTHGGIPVWGGEAIIHLDRGGQVADITDDFLVTVTPQPQSLRPSVTSQHAIDRAMEAAKITASDLTSPAVADQWIFRHASGDRVTWRVRLERIDGSPDSSAPVLFVDAQTGEVLWKYNGLQTGTGNSMYSGTVPLTTTLSGSIYQLKDGSRGNQQTNNLNHATIGPGTLFTDADDVWGNGTNSDPATAGVDAQFGAQVTWDYYKNVHGRNGIRNDGVGAYSRVHYGNNYVNAFWDDSCFCMTYGDGSGNTHPLTSMDVAGHEMTHGVTSNTADLIYSGESGGLNEATSDIMGSSIEFYADNAADVGDYLIGEKIDIHGNGTPLRYMDRPSKDGASADCWSSSVGNLDVHHSSGVANHFFYLLSEGSGAKTINGVSYNSPTCNGFTVTGITRAKAEKIWYRALTGHMTASTNYAGARTATLKAAADLYGAGSAEQMQVDAAWAAVNVRPDVSQWTDDVQIPGQTSPYQPGLAPFANRLYMAYRGNDNTNIYVTSFGGSSWSTASAIPGQLAESGPALTVFDDRLTVLYHANGQNRLMMSTSSNGSSWSSPVTAGTSLGTSTVKYAPAITVHQGALYAAYCKQPPLGAAEKVHLDRFDGTSWTVVADFSVPVPYNCKHVALATLPDGRLDLVYTISNQSCSGSTCWYMYEVQGFGHLTVWTTQLMSMKSKQPPAIVSCGGTTHLVHGGYSTPEEIWWSFWDGTKWTDNVKVPNQTSNGGAGLGCYQGTRALMIHNGGTSQLGWSEFGR